MRGTGGSLVGYNNVRGGEGRRERMEGRREERGGEGREEKGMLSKCLNVNNYIVLYTSKLRYVAP